MTGAALLRPCRLLRPIDAPAIPLDRMIREALDGAPWAAVRAWIQSGKVSVDGNTTLDARAVVHPASEVVIDPRASRSTGASAISIRLVHVDAQIVVADKPAGISTVPFDSDERDTFDELVRRELGKRSRQHPPPLGIVHRIDKATSGLVVFARTTQAKRHLKQQFRFHSIHRVYLALVSGNIESQTIRTQLVPDRGDGRRGSTTRTGLGQIAVTHVEVIERLRGATLVHCRLETGRTHQIRIHLAELGHPLLGERVYQSKHSTPETLATRQMLHAAELGLVHPSRDVEVHFESEPPRDFSELLSSLRQTAPR